jgi:1-acyl-sn-glycerol-3-phosphate acyltransferase
MPGRMTVSYRLLASLIRSIIVLNGGLTVEGTENIPETGGVLVASNHISYLDPPLIGAVLPRRATFLARKGLFDTPLIKWIVRRNAIPVDRQRPRPSTIKEAVRLLRSGELVVIFPEGRRSDTGALMEGKRGVGLIVRMSGVPVCPALITGADRVLPINARWIKRGAVNVRFGRPIHFGSTEAVDTASRAADYEEISRTIMDAISALREAPGKK